MMILKKENNLSQEELADKLGVSLEEITMQKLEKNAEKYPIDKAKGTSKKYTEL